jgi:cobalt-zinc-cadmium efflux system protein
MMLTLARHEVAKMFWAMSTTETAMTVHLVLPGGYPGDAFTAGLARKLKSKFSIGHATMQIETDPAANCVLEPDRMTERRR